jgi:hypothetical protein
VENQSILTLQCCSSEKACILYSSTSLTKGKIWGHASLKGGFFLERTGKCGHPLKYLTPALLYLPFIEHRLGCGHHAKYFTFIFQAALQ